MFLKLLLIALGIAGVSFGGKVKSKWLRKSLPYVGVIIAVIGVTMITGGRPPFLK